MLAAAISSAGPTHADVLYETDFENFTVGTEELTNTDSWQASLVDGFPHDLHGIDLEIVPGLGKTAFLGLDDPDDSQQKEIGAEVVSVFRPIVFDPVAEDKPIVEFEALIAIAASQDVAGTLQNEANIEDRFLISFYNNSAQFLASIIYDTRTASYGLWRNDGASFGGTTDTGIEFIIETPQFLYAEIDYQNNTWSASLDGVPIFTDAPFTATGNSRTLGLVAAELRCSTRVFRQGVGAVWRPANNWMLIDDWYISARSREMAPLTEPFEISKVERTADAKVELTYPADEGCTYRIQYSTDLNTWIELGDSPVSASTTDPLAKYTDAPPAGQRRYYRIIREAGD